MNFAQAHDETIEHLQFVPILPDDRVSTKAQGLAFTATVPRGYNLAFVIKINTIGGSWPYSCSFISGTCSQASTGTIIVIDSSVALYCVTNARCDCSPKAMLSANARLTPPS